MHAHPLIQVHLLYVTRERSHPRVCLHSSTRECTYTRVLTPASPRTVTRALIASHPRVNCFQLASEALATRVYMLSYM